MGARFFPLNLAAVGLPADLGRMRSIFNPLVLALLGAAGLSACQDRPATTRTDPALAALLAELRMAESASAAEIVEAQIWAHWSQSGSATVDVLLERAMSAEAAGDLGLAQAFLDQAAELAPGFAEPWHRRAALAYESQDYAGAIRAIEETLKREPQHFAAYAALGVVYEAMGQEGAALAAYREALSIHPHLVAAQQGERRLSARLTGEEA
jgi:tetratricopeptide (TPR) repeat protein